MLFFSRANKLLYWAAPIKALYRYTLTATACVMLFATWWFCIYAPLCAFNLSYVQENQIMQQQCDHAKQECTQLSCLEDTVKELQYTMDAYAIQVSYNPREVHINDVVQAVQASGLSLCAYNTEKEIDKKLYTKSTMRLSLSGGYQQLLNFFEQMHTKKMLMLCKNISLQTASEPEKYTISCELTSFSWLSKKPSNLE